MTFAEAPLIHSRWFFLLSAILLLNLQQGAVYGIQFTPIVEDITNCALVLTSLAQYSTDLLQNGINEPVHCITYDAINEAYIEARKYIGIPEAETNWKPEDVAKIGDLILDISTTIAKLYDLSPEDIQIALPQIDTMKTLIRDVCPAYLSSVNCKAGRYRRFDGLCNNIEHPSWGATVTPYTRLISPQFSDHISAPRKGVTGNDLPSARIVSRAIHTDEGYHDHASTVMTVAWGQFMDHDFTLMGTPLDLKNRNEPEECCYRPQHLKNAHCMEIAIPEDDYFYQKYRVKCQDFVRAYPAVQPGCKLGSRNPFNTLTAVIDANTIYGVDENLARYLRSGIGGQLRMNPVFSQLGLKDLLPMKTDIPDEGCIRTNSSQFCFLSGEIRVNEQLVLTCIHTLMAREHNRVAALLAHINPHWDDELLYQEARRIVIAEIQHITFNEFLPLLLGKEVMEKYSLLLEKEGYWNGYDPDANPNIMDAFASAAFRFGHSLLPSANERWSKAHRFIASKRLSELIRKPYDLYRAGVFDEYLIGLTNQVAQAMDDSITQEVTNHLIQKPGNYFGLDLVSFNIQRGRDFGLPSYMQYRKHCGLDIAEDFTEMFGFMPNSTVYRYMSIYEHPNDIDLWSGGVSEKPLPGSMLGPTFACIIATQMDLIRKGDRFWYELPNQPSSFTPEQLREIRKVKLSRIICDNSDLIDTIQMYPMVLPDHELNRRVSCKSSVLPSLNLEYWADGKASAASVSSFDTQLTTTVTRDGANEGNPCFGCFGAVDGEEEDKLIIKPEKYEYHAKTIAIIDGATAGSSPILDIKDLFQSPWSYPVVSDFAKVVRRISKRSAPDPVNATVSDNEPSVNATDGDSASGSVGNRRSLSKRHSPREKNHHMTQAIMRGGADNKESIDRSETGYNAGARAQRRYRAEPQEYDIENIFRKNVPIYDGFIPASDRKPAVPLGYSTTYVNPKVKNAYPQFENTYHGRDKDDEKQDEAEEEEDSDGLINVHEDHEAQHEYVPMDVTEDGKQVVMKRPFLIDDEEEELEEEPEEEDAPKYREHDEENAEDEGDAGDAVESPKYRNSNGDSNYPATVPNIDDIEIPKYRTDGSFDFGSTYSHDPGYGSGRDFLGPTTRPSFSHSVSAPQYSYDGGATTTPVGTSHQFNSAGDNRPYYYSHHRPSSHMSQKTVFPASSSSSDFSIANPRPAPPPNYDFVPKRGNFVTPPYNGNSPPRATHVPHSLEEYHRIHGDKAERTSSDDNGNREEDYATGSYEPSYEPEEDYSPSKNSARFSKQQQHRKGDPPKSFMTLNFGPDAVEENSQKDEVATYATRSNFEKSSGRPASYRKPFKPSPRLPARQSAASFGSSPTKSRDGNDELFHSIKSATLTPTIVPSLSLDDHRGDSRRPYSIQSAAVTARPSTDEANVSSKQYHRYYREKQKSRNPATSTLSYYRETGKDDGRGGAGRAISRLVDENPTADATGRPGDVKFLDRVSRSFGDKIVKRRSVEYENDRETDSSKENIENEDEDDTDERSEIGGGSRGEQADVSVEESSLRRHRGGSPRSRNRDDNDSGEEKHFWQENNSESYVE